MRNALWLYDIHAVAMRIYVLELLKKQCLQWYKKCSVVSITPLSLMYWYKNIYQSFEIIKEIDHLLGPQLINVYEWVELEIYSSQRVETFRYGWDMKSQTIPKNRWQ